MTNEWPPSDEAFQAFLAWLSPDREEAGRRLEKLKQELIRVLTWRGCPTPDDLFWETVARAANRVHAGKVGHPSDPIAYCYGVAKFVYLEWYRVPDPDELPSNVSVLNPEPTWSELEMACLDECLERLREHDRNLVLRYREFTGRKKIETRKLMAAEEGGSNALRLKIFRLDKKLRSCVLECAERGGKLTSQ